MIGSTDGFTKFYSTNLQKNKAIFNIIFLLGEQIMGDIHKKICNMSQSPPNPGFRLFKVEN